MLANAVAVAEICVALWGLVRSELGGSTVVIDSIRLDPGFAMQLYSSLAVGGIVFLIGLNWMWLYRFLPATKFREMENDIKLVVDSVYALLLDDGLVRSRADALQHKLARLGIILPDDFVDWDIICPRLLTFAMDGRIREARRFMAAHNKRRDQ